MPPIKPIPVYASATAFAVTYVAARFVLRFPDLHTAIKVTAALLPLPFLTWMLWSMMRYVKTLDELEQRIQLQALAIAFSSSMLLLMTLGLLQLAIHLPEGDWSYRHVWAFLPFSYYVGLAVARTRYQ